MRRALEPLVQRSRQTVARGVVSRVDDSTKAQELQVRLLKGEVREGVERLQQVGLSVVPEPGAEHVTLFLGSREHPITIAVDDRRYRPTGQAEGELTLYQPKAGGSFIRFFANGDVEVKPASGKLVVTGSVEASVDVEDLKGTMEEIRTFFNVHVHPENGGAGPTGPPTVPMT